MGSGAQLRARRVLAITVTAAAVALACVIGVWRPWAPVPAADSAMSDESLSVIPTSPLSLPEEPELLVFGDSWTYGQAAAPVTDGYAYVLGHLTGWHTTVAGESGSGYLKEGAHGRTFGDRVAALPVSLDPDLVILQGSINDRWLPADGYRAAVSRTWDAFEDLYPDAAIVILGPATQVLPVEDTTARIDHDLASLAAARGWWYISPIEEKWITAQDYTSIIDTSEAGLNHPSTEGHSYLADRVSQALTRIQEPTAPIEAGEEPQPIETAGIDSAG